MFVHVLHHKAHFPQDWQQMHHLLGGCHSFCTVPFYWNENWTTKKLSSPSSQKKGSLTTNLQGIAQPLAVHHQPLLLGMLSSHLVEDLHWVLPQRSQQTWNTENTTGWNQQNHLVGHGLYQNRIRKQFSCRLLVRPPFFKISAIDSAFHRNRHLLLVRLCIQKWSADFGARSHLTPVEVLLNQVFIHVAQLLF